VNDVGLLVLGDANPDLMVRGGDVVPAFGQAEQLVDEARLVLGGSGGIMACGAARLGLRVALAGVIGDDLFGRFVREQLEANGVDARGLTVDPGRTTGLTIVLSNDRDRGMLTAPGTIGDLRGNLVDPGSLQAARHVHVSSYFLQRALAPDLPRLFDLARAHGATTSLDPNWDPTGRWDGGLAGVLDRTDVFLPNEVEATRIARASNVDDAVRSLSRRAGVVVVKVGDGGAVAGAAGDIVRVRPLEVRPIDTTGAGDSFDAGFLATWLDGAPLERCLAFANACGALSTLGIGGTAAQPTTDEVLAAIERGSAA
jgi:sugar/nucleoside kinase (ribokinase family)